MLIFYCDIQHKYTANACITFVAELTNQNKIFCNL